MQICKFVNSNLNTTVPFYWATYRAEVFSFYINKTIIISNRKICENIVGLYKI